MLMVVQSLSKKKIGQIGMTDVILDFNPALMGSDLKAKYVLFEEKEQGWHHIRQQKILQLQENCKRYSGG